MKKQQIIGAFRWELLGTVVTLGTGFLVSLFLSRLLTPEEFGIVAMAMSFIAIFSAIGNLGFGEALIQNAENDNTIYSSVFYINLLLGFILCIFFFFVVAPSIASYYSEKLYLSIIRILSFLFIINNIASIQGVILRINLNFKILTFQAIVSSLISGGIGIWMALMNKGVYAIITQVMVSAVIQTVMLWSCSRWRPLWVFEWGKIKQLFSFGGYILLGNLTNILVKRLDEPVIGKLFSISMVGYYGRANSIFNLVKTLVSKSLTSIFFPVLSQMKNEEFFFKELYLKVIFFISFFSFFLTGILMISGEALILGLFGLQWRNSVTIFEITMYTLYSYPINSFLIVALLAKGFSKEVFYHSLIRKTLKLSTFIIAYFYGFNAFLYSIVVFIFVSTIYNIVVNSALLKVSFIQQLKEIVSPFLIFFVSMKGVSYIYIGEGMYCKTIFISIIFMVLYILLSMLFLKEKMKDLLELIKSTIKK